MKLPTLPTGQRFGRLVVLSFERDPHRPKYPFYRCRCDCGSVLNVQRANLGKTTNSCGCIKREMLQAKATHGMSSSPEFKTWCGMKDRCYRVGRKDFSRYGALGITICQRWLDAFEHFYADMGPRPSARHSIDRIDTNGNYEPGNCRWATAREQRMNQRRMLH